MLTPIASVLVLGRGNPEAPLSPRDFISCLVRARDLHRVDTADHVHDAVHCGTDTLGEVGDKANVRALHVFILNAEVGGGFLSLLRSIDDTIRQSVEVVQHAFHELARLAVIAHLNETRLTLEVPLLSLLHHVAKGHVVDSGKPVNGHPIEGDRKSRRLNSSHVSTSY